MKAKINQKLFNESRFDSGELSVLTMTVHQFNIPGFYQAVVQRQGLEVSKFYFTVAENSPAMELHIDLSEVARRVYTVQNNSMKIVSPKGYVLFYSSYDYGYTVLVSDRNGDRVFDSTKLGEGDIFSLSLLTPGRYSILNGLESVSGEIIVNPIPESIKNFDPASQLNIDVSQDKYTPEQVEIISGQGLVFHIKTSDVRVIIQKNQPQLEQFSSISKSRHWRYNIFS
jgi:hypothetical protein